MKVTKTSDMSLLKTIEYLIANKDVMLVLVAATIE